MKIFKTKFYIVRYSSSNYNSAELLGGPFDARKDADLHLYAANIDDLDVELGSDLLEVKVRLQDKRPEKEE